VSYNDRGPLHRTSCRVSPRVVPSTGSQPTRLARLRRHRDLTPDAGTQVWAPQSDVVVARVNLLHLRRVFGLAGVGLGSSQEPNHRLIPQPGNCAGLEETHVCEPTGADLSRHDVSPDQILAAVGSVEGIDRCPRCLGIVVEA
jgi:hypothetical protein